MIKPLSIEATLETVWLDDPAFEPVSDKEAREVRANKYYADPGSWPDLVKTEGAYPVTKFVIGVITAEDMARIESESGGAIEILAWKCFAMGLRDIKDGPTVTETDSSGRTKEVVPKVKRRGVEYVDPEWLTRIFVRGLRGCALQIGLAIFQWQRMSELDSKN